MIRYAGVNPDYTQRLKRCWMLFALLKGQSEYQPKAS
ncbi:hypothetical protein EMIT0P4_330006 [Pseudomonas sp. IT-P4]